MEFDTYHIVHCKHCGTFFTVREEDCRRRKYDDYLSGLRADGLYGVPGFIAYYPCPTCLKTVGIHLPEEEDKHD